MCERGAGCPRSSRYLPRKRGGAASTSRSYGIGEVACPLDKKTTRNAWFVTVLQTDTGRRAEYAKARERTLVKELGKLAP